MILTIFYSIKISEIDFFGPILAFCTNQNDLFSLLGMFSAFFGNGRFYFSHLSPSAPITGIAP